MISLKFCCFSFLQLPIALTLSLTSTTTLKAQQAFSNEQYLKAQWMTTRFYGAQRSGYGPNWLLANHTPKPIVHPDFVGTLPYFNYAVKGQNFVKDADIDGYDLTGGWFDCGDFVKFGQTQYYSAYMLLLGYSEFPKGYPDYYSADYNGYIGANNYSWAGKAGVPNGIPDVLDEVKYATDYFIKCVRSNEKFYYQVGDGDADHKWWTTATLKAALPREDGGELEGSRKVYSITEGGTSMVAFCGASLAAMARLYKCFDAEYANLCLEKALQAYEFIENGEKGNIESRGATDIFYGKKQKYEPDCVVLCMELFRTTNDSTYLSKAKKYGEYINTATGWTHGYHLNFNNTEDLPLYLLGAYAGDSSATHKLGLIVEQNYNKLGRREELNYLLDNHTSSRPMRAAANQAFVNALYYKLKGITDVVEPHCQRTIDYIMGDNDNKFSFITGLTNNSPIHPHHRNYYFQDMFLWDTDFICNPKYRELGYLVGGNFDLSLYNDHINNAITNEGGIDFNAGLVGALGYINSIINPGRDWVAECSSDSNSVKNQCNEVICYLYPNPTTDYIYLKSREEGAVKLTIYRHNGAVEIEQETSWEELRNGVDVSYLPAGSHLIDLRSKNGSVTKLLMKR